MGLNYGNALYYLFRNILSRILFYNDVTIVWIKMLSSLLFCVGLKLDIIRTVGTEKSKCVGELYNFYCFITIMLIMYRRLRKDAHLSALVLSSAGYGHVVHLFSVYLTL